MMATEVLQSASIDVLLRSAYSLTHQIHDFDNPGQSLVGGEIVLNRSRLPSLRAQRDQIDAEIKRRVGEEHRCVCGRLFQTRGARSTHARKCPQEQARSEDFTDRIEARA